MTDTPTKTPPRSPSRRATGKSREERDQARRQKLIDAALELFTARGTMSTPIDTLCQTAGVSTRDFYNLFGTREAVLKACFDQVIGIVASGLLKAIEQAPDNDPEARLRAGIAGFLHAYLDDPRYAVLTCIAAVGVSPEMENHRTQTHYQFARVLELETQRLAERGLLPTAPSDKLPLALVGAINELIVDWVKSSPRPPIEKLINDASLLLEIQLAGLVAKFWSKT